MKKEEILAALDVEALKAKVESLTMEVGLPNEIERLVVLKMVNL